MSESSTGGRKTRSMLFVDPTTVKLNPDDRSGPFPPPGFPSLCRMKIGMPLNLPIHDTLSSSSS